MSLPEPTRTAVLEGPTSGEPSYDDLPLPLRRLYSPEEWRWSRIGRTEREMIDAEFEPGFVE